MTEWTNWADTRHAIRLLRKQPMVAITLILALAIGIGMATTGYTFLDSVLFGELPFPNGDRFVKLSTVTDPEADRASMGIERLQLLQDRAHAITYLGALESYSYNILHASGEVENVNGAALTPGWFRFLPYKPLIGRLLIPDDGKPGATPVVVIRRSLWERRFNSDTEAIGSTINVGGTDRTLVGVLHDDCQFPARGELWIPLESGQFADSAGRTGPVPRLAGILAEGVTIETASSQVLQLVSQFQEQRPDVEAIRVKLDPFTDLSELRISMPLIVGVTVMILVLMLVAANVANLILAQNAARTSELAIRSVLGAGRGRLIRQLFVEVLSLGAVAAAIGLVVSQSLLKFIDKSIEELPFWISFRPSPRTIIFVVAVTLLATAVAGVWPALRATRRDLVVGLRAGAGRGSAEGMGPLSSIMIVLETTFSVALLSAAVVFAWGFTRYAEQTLDLPQEKILTAQIYIKTPAASGPTLERIGTESHDALLRAVAEVPGIDAFGTTSSLPKLSPRSERIEFESVNGAATNATAMVPQVGIRPGFLDALQGRAISGRMFAPSDLYAEAPAVAIVNQPFVDNVLSGQNPIGRRFRVVPQDEDEARPEWREIVGLVPDLGILVGDPDRTAGYYVPLRHQNLFYLAMRTSGNPQELAAPLRQAIFKLDPEILVTRVVPLETVGHEDQTALLALGSVLTALGFAALGLSLVGMYAIMSLAVTRRTREIGIRVALGATRRQILESVLGRSGALLAFGAILGSVTAMGLMSVMDKILVSQLPNPGAWVAPFIALFLGVAGLLASWAPAHRALGINPTEALGHD